MLVDPDLLPGGSDEARVVREAHRWYEHLISLWTPGIIEAAFDLGVFGALARGPRPAADLASELGCDAEAMRVLLDGLCSYDLLQRVPGDSGVPVYVLPAEAAACLRPDGLYSLAGKIDYDRALAWNAWRNLADSVRAGAREEDGSERLNQICASDVLITMVQGFNFWAPPVVEILATALEERGWASGNPRELLDVGCGAGLYSQLLMRRFPFVSAVGLDDHRIIPVAVAQSKRLGVAARFRPVICDFQADEWGKDFGLVLVSNVFHLQTHESARNLVNKAGQALSDDGYLAIVDHIIDEDLDGQSRLDKYFRLFAVSMLATGGGGAYRVADYEEWFAGAGLRRVALLDTPMHRILLAARADPG